MKKIQKTIKQGKSLSQIIKPSDLIEKCSKDRIVLIIPIVLPNG